MNINKRVSLNLDVRGLNQSATLAINDRCRQLQSEGRNVYRLGLGQSPFPVPVVVVDALKLHAHEKDYLPAKGHPELRRAVAGFHRRKDGVKADRENVLIGPGSKELMFILQLVYYGELLVPTPCWVSYVPQAKIIGRKVSLLHTRYEDKWHITAESLQRHCESQEDRFRPRILVLNYPGNPDGCTYTSTELKDLAEVARRFEVVLLSDEIYGQLHHQGAHVSVAKYYPEGTIVSSGLSKWCGAGGWRLGTFTFPPDLDWLLESMAVVASETYTSVSAPIQYAAVRAFQGGVTIERYLWHARRILAALGSQAAGELKKTGINVHLPEGAFYLFLDFSPLQEKFSGRGIDGSVKMCEKLIEDTGVAIIPGEAFERPSDELTARLAYVDFDGARALAASETLPLDQRLPEDFTKRWCPKVLEAVQRLCDWISS
ncbi:MAG: aminotransferase class I/II-fold pyridoxal phosphate-dependent enzyme [Candidatus Zixiibacteriota bacterium]|nr:MAG: aminotransferase class I/II-fold pyridoxal phosphate-dependent enzyme [candidate division Zixibacteria bacterium]